MKLQKISNNLDEEFQIKPNEENLVEWAISEDTKEFVNPDFMKGKTGLITKNSDEIERVFTVVFITDTIIRKIKQFSGSLLITHHHFNYYEDERGLCPIQPETFGILKDNRNSIYVAHAPLDTHPVYGTSKCLAELCGITIDEYFFDYFGAPTALIGHINRERFESFSEQVRKKIERPYLTQVKNRDYIEKIAVAAGGGDIPELLQYTHDKGCDTILTGTVEHRWDIPPIQEGNKKFHELNLNLKLNLLGGTHFATERPAMIKLPELINSYGVQCEYMEDGELLNVK